MRSDFLVGLSFAATLSAATAAGAQPSIVPVPVGPFADGIFPATRPMSPETTAWQVVNAFPALTFPDTTVIVANPADSRLYVGSRSGVVLSTANEPNATADDLRLFLDVSDTTAVVWDGGFLGLAFHPSFGVPNAVGRNYVYAYYSSHCPLEALDPTRVDLAACDESYPRQGTGGFFNVYNRLSRFELVDGETSIDPESERVLFNTRLYNSSHRGGGMLFGDDGYLYVALGDQFRYETAQDLTSTFEGGVVRLAVDVTETASGWSCPPGSHMPRRRFSSVDEVTGQLYCIPDDNPFLDATSKQFEEYFSVGHRNPHRMTKDLATGRIWIGEIGESTREEINVVERGDNHGWPFREGKVPGPRPAPESYVGTLVEPVVDFSRNDANAIIGGYVYRGSRFPELAGSFLAGDYVTAKLFAISYEADSKTGAAQQIGSFTPGALGTWGQDNAGELFLGSVGGAGDVFTLARVGEPVLDPPELLSDLGIFDDLSSLDFVDSCIPYDLNQPFWSDGAVKTRCMILPNDGDFDGAAERIEIDPQGQFRYPTGTVFVKHFDLPIDERNPSLTTRLETRFLVNGGPLTGFYGLTYRWLENQRDARLLSAGESRVINVTRRDASVDSVTWRFPSREQCSACHTKGGGGALGARVHGIHRDYDYADGGPVNQLRAWNDSGLFRPALADAKIEDLPRAPRSSDVTAPLDDRARSYLDANCSYCHRPDTGNRAQMDLRFTTPFVGSGTVWAGVSDDLGIADAHIVTPGSPETSMLYVRSTLLGDRAMPPLAKGAIDFPGTELIAEWIERLPPNLPRSGLHYAYYELADPRLLPNFSQLTPVKTGLSATFDLSPRNRNDWFAFEFWGYLRVIEGGTYTFYTNSDDGSRLYLNDALIVDNDGLHGPVEASGAVTLQPGYHELRVTMFENTGGESLNVSWTPPGGAQTPISTANLFPNVPLELMNLGPVLQAPPAITSEPAQSVLLQLDAVDPDEDALYFDAAGLPPGLLVDHDSGQIHGVVDMAAVGDYLVTVSASDGPEVDHHTFLWTVGVTGGGEGGAGGDQSGAGAGNASGGISTGGTSTGGIPNGGGATAGGDGRGGAAEGGQGNGGIAGAGEGQGGAPHGGTDNEPSAGSSSIGGQLSGGGRPDATAGSAASEGGHAVDGGDNGGQRPPGGSDDSGCGCKLGTKSADRRATSLLALAAVATLLRRRRTR
jgi:uncharacterized repeat protein (TIGR03806 family)